MKLSKWTKTLAIGVAVLTLAACHSTHKKDYDQNAINDENSAYNSGGARSSGLGDDTLLEDQESGGGQRSASNNKRVYYFDFDSNVVRDEDKPAIMAHANYLSKHANSKMLLEGHTDPRGSREYNVGLGERRAKAVAQLMASKGVSPSQIRVVSYGAEKLASAGRNESDYQQDRRAALVTLKQ